MNKGRASIIFEKKPYIISAASLAGPKEGKGPLGQYFDYTDKDGKMGEKTWEQAESKMQEKAAQTALQKAGMNKSNIDYIFAGDLLGQSIASSFGAENMMIPYIGTYGACSTMGLTLSLAALFTAAGYSQNSICVTSSHFACAEKQFRFPLDYGNQRPLSAEWTVTGSGAFIVSSSCRKPFAAIAGITTGRIIDFGIKDSMNMGAAMAPAAADTIYTCLKDLEVDEEYFDMIVTGDLGKIGSRILCDLLLEKKIDIEKRHFDCGLKIYSEDQDVHSGGSGCGCSALVLASYILPRIQNGVYKRILFVPTGALLSKISFNEGQNVPGIAHAVILEHAAMKG